ncbi:MAG: FMN-binding protein [Melioribacteraceae bacterium]|jgi:electron transport complex protein RnfG|nr:FMN-binding protein [Melioribacteraceae bacterium]
MKLAIKMIFTLSIIGIISGSLLSKLSGWAEPKIAKHRLEDTKKAIFLVQPKANTYKKIESLDFELYKVSINDSLIGYALPYSGSGFQGNIRLMIGLDCNLIKITGMRVLEQVETPGLGTKVTEESFTCQFIDLVTNPLIECIKGAKATKVNEVEAITGATISSKAVLRIINTGLGELRSLKAEGKLR